MKQVIETIVNLIFQGTEDVSKKEMLSTGFAVCILITNIICLIKEVWIII